MDHLRIAERYELTGAKNLLVQREGSSKLVAISESSAQKATKNFFPNFCREVFLPRGYPGSVSADYFHYQFYDTVQAFCSRITATISTKAILQGVGVGDAHATALGAALTWIFKDGTGMFGAIVFAWWKGAEFDGDCKKWRLLADVLNDCAMVLELLLPAWPGYATPLLCCTTCMKSAVGVAGGATRAAITQHQARAGNSADVAAKDASQETAVNLVASVFSVLLLTFIADGRFEWSLFMLFTIVHLLANYAAVSSLVFDTLNEARFVIIMKSYCRFNKVADLETVNRKESVLLGYGTNARQFCGFDIRLGESLAAAVRGMSAPSLEHILDIYSRRQYAIVPNVAERWLRVVLVRGASTSAVLEAYFHALVLGLGVSLLRHVDLEYLHKTLKESVMERLAETVHQSQPDDIFGAMRAVDQFVASEWTGFAGELERNGWSRAVHSLKVRGWTLELDSLLHFRRTTHA